MKKIFVFAILFSTLFTACSKKEVVSPENSPEVQNPPSTNDEMTEADAKLIAEKSCIKGGEALAAGTYNEKTKTWWFDANLNATKPGCSPACVLDVEKKTADINWRCTGAIETPSETNVEESESTKQPQT